MNILSFILVVAGVVLLFGAAVFVHEFGHFWVARKRGLKVEAFAIGFGPKMFGWTKDGIEYSFRWIPAGGFVKLPQMLTSSAIEGSAEAADQEPLPPVSPLSKILVAIAGPFMNVVFAFAIAGVIWFVGLPEPVNPSVIGYVDPDSAEAALGIEAGDRIVSIDGEEVSTWEDVYMTVALARTTDFRLGISRDDEVKEYVVQAEKNDALGLKMLNLYAEDSVLIAEVLEGKPGGKAGMQKDDRVVSYMGYPVFSREQLIDFISGNPEKAATIEVERAGEVLALTVTPELEPSSQQGRIGVILTSTPPEYIVKRPGPTPWEQVSAVWNQTLGTIGALIHSKETGVGAKDLSGPVGILSVLGIQLSIDYRLALKFLVLLNINLAILNLLPVPVLDGGHIMMSVFEAIFGKPISPRIQEYATSVFALLLISFMLYVTYFDLDRLPLFKDLFNDEPTIHETVPADP